MGSATPDRETWGWGDSVLPRLRVLDVFTLWHYDPEMPEDSNLRPATDDEILHALEFALRFKGRKHHHHADNFMSRIAAEYLLQHLRESRFVVMKRPPEHRTVPGSYYRKPEQ